MQFTLLQALAFEGATNYKLRATNLKRTFFLLTLCIHFSACLLPLIQLHASLPEACHLWSSTNDNTDIYFSKQTCINVTVCHCSASDSIGGQWSAMKKGYTDGKPCAEVYIFLLDQERRWTMTACLLLV